VREGQEMPGYLRAIGVAMLAWGLLGVMLLRRSDSATAWGWVFAAGFLAGGIGLVLARRWGWPLALLEAVANLGVGIFEIVTGRANPALATVILQLVPSGLAMWGLFTPRSLAWLRARPPEVGPAGA